MCPTGVGQKWEGKDLLTPPTPQGGCCSLESYSYSYGSHYLWGKENTWVVWTRHVARGYRSLDDEGLHWWASHLAASSNSQPFMPPPPPLEQPTQVWPVTGGRMKPLLLSVARLVPRNVLKSVPNFWACPHTWIWFGDQEWQNLPASLIYIFRMDAPHD